MMQASIGRSRAGRHNGSDQLAVDRMNALIVDVHPDKLRATIEDDEDLPSVTPTTGSEASSEADDDGCDSAISEDTSGGSADAYAPSSDTES